ncbi:MAG: alpha/beta fold hydrolase [Bacteroidia bacterium]|nr:alpha/beta fold hydrolase [Bacteroidia bacterium]
MKQIKNYVLAGPHGRPIVTDVILPEKTLSSIPIVVFCHGYKGFKDWGAWNQMTMNLANSGFCIIKFNFSFNGGTAEQPIDFPDLEAFANNNYSKELDDLKQVIDWIYADPLFDHPVDRTNICVMGHSRGGGIAAIAASEDDRIKQLITLAAVSDFESRFEIGSETFKKWEEKGVKYVLNGRTKQQMPHYFQFFEDFLTHRDRLNIKRALTGLDKPHLIIHGDADTSVSIEAGHDMAKWSKHSELKIIKGADHVFGSSHPWGKDSISIQLQQVIGYAVGFLKTNLA